MTVQTMPEVSPTKWHLAHVNWFFERFVLADHAAGFQPFDEAFDYLFNSYYYTAGDMHARPRRGLLSRPSVDRILDYRRHVDENMMRLLENPDKELSFLVTLGLHHEQQHQELMLMDIKHVFAQNPIRPAYGSAKPSAGHGGGELDWHGFPGGIAEIGFTGDGFCFDNETPRHRVLVEDFEIASRPVTNSEFHAFISDGGYETCDLWLSDGWATVQTEGWRHPLYWSEDLGREFTLGGELAIDPQAPVCHVSFYEADAYARWAGARLPSEAEWELAASHFPVAGNFVESGVLHPRSAPGDGMRQIYGDVWEWTASPYAPYPGFHPLAGSLGEYNGKFMCNQMVLRGGSCVTPSGHVRPSYRNFFYPANRWQFSGLRLARDA
jgi:ergothioneine biosynthesis protein EgtB